MIDCFQTLPSQDHLQLSLTFRKIGNRFYFAVFLLHCRHFTPIRLKREIIGILIFKGNSNLVYRDGKLFHTLYMGIVVQLNQITDNRSVLCAGNFNRVGKNVIARLIMVKLPSLVLVGVFDINLPFTHDMSSVRTGHPEKMLVFGGLCCS